VIIIRGQKFISLRLLAAQAGSVFPRSTIFNVGRAALLSAAFTALVFSAGTAVADPIGNGTDGQFTDTTGNPFFDPVPTDPGYNPTAVQVKDQVADFSFGSETGTVESWVIATSANNPYAVEGGGLVEPAMTFVYQITLTGDTGDIGSLGAADFGINQTDVGYYDQTGSQIWPSFVNRDLGSDGVSTVSFDFLNLGGQYSTVNGGEQSALLVVNTDATIYSNTYVTLQDDANGTASSYAIYAPMFATPEPGSIVLMVLGLTGVLAVARARRSGRFAARAVS
jgi:hypothetical protein